MAIFTNLINRVASQVNKAKEAQDMPEDDYMAYEDSDEQIYDCYDDDDEYYFYDSDEY